MRKVIKDYSNRSLQRQGGVVKRWRDGKSQALERTKGSERGHRNATEGPGTLSATCEVPLGLAPHTRSGSHDSRSLGLSVSRLNRG